MQEQNAQQPVDRQEEKRPYTPPAVIYATQITTRAGSPLGPADDKDPVDPADLFGD